jgi:hypothetical protein
MKNHFKYIFCLLLFVMIKPFALQAQVFEVAINKDTILIGDVFTLEMSVTNFKNAEILFPIFKDTIGKFEILEDFALVKTDNKVIKKWDLSIYDEGIYELNGFKTLAKQKDGTIDTLSSTEIVVLHVNTLPVDTTKAYKPIKPAKSIPFPLKEMVKKYALYALIFIHVLLILLALYFYFKKKKNKQTIEKTPLDFHAETIEKLKKIEQQKLWQNDQTKAYYFAISEILRNYLEGRYRINAMESTTDEIYSNMIALHENKAMSLKLKEVLQQCDLAKFAKFKPLADENTKFMKYAQDFVLHTKPKPVEENQSTDEK